MLTLPSAVDGQWTGQPTRSFDELGPNIHGKLRIKKKRLLSSTVSAPRPKPILDNLVHRELSPIAFVNLLTYLFVCFFEPPQSSKSRDTKRVQISKTGGEATVQNGDKHILS